MVAMLASRLSPPSPVRPKRLTSQALDRCIDAMIADRTENFDRTLPFDSTPPSQPTHISLTLAARVAHWTDFFARCFDALTLFGASTIMTGMTAAMRDLVLMMSVTPKY